MFADVLCKLPLGGDKIDNAVWRAGPGGAVEALAAAGSAVQTDVFIMLGINDVTKRAPSNKVVLDVVGGVWALARELKARLQSDCTRIHFLGSQQQMTSAKLAGFFTPCVTEDASRV